MRSLQGFEDAENLVETATTARRVAHDQSNLLTGFENVYISHRTGQALRIGIFGVQQSKTGGYLSRRIAKHGKLHFVSSRGFNVLHPVAVWFGAIARKAADFDTSFFKGGCSGRSLAQFGRTNGSKVAGLVQVKIEETSNKTKKVNSSIRKPEGQKKALVESKGILFGHDVFWFHILFSYVHENDSPVISQVLIQVKVWRVLGFALQIGKLIEQNMASIAKQSTKHIVSRHSKKLKK